MAELESRAAMGVTSVVDLLPPPCGEGGTKGRVGERHPPVARARAMRKALTPPEARLWVDLKRLRADGFHFRRQAPFRGYFLDFVCFSCRLVVEVDGIGHDHEVQARHDEVRGGVLAREGFRTLRFTNADVRDRLGAVLDAILGALAEAGPHPAASRPPSP